MTTFSSGSKRIAIVGCGPCGLTAVKQFRDEGHEVVCFDPNREVGGIWYVDPEDKDRTAVYQGGYLTIDNKLMCYSDDQPEGPGEFYTFQQYEEYLVNYSYKFDLRKHIKLESKVVKTCKKGGGWDVTYCNTATNLETTEHFDMLVVSTGSNGTNKIPKEIEGFEGEVCLSGFYVNNKPFEGKRVLVVGSGESAADMTKEISDAAADCTWSMRNFPAVIPRVPNTYHSTNALTARCHYGVQKTVDAEVVMPGFSESYVLKLLLLPVAVMAFLYELVFYRLLGRAAQLFGMAKKRKTDPFGQKLGQFIDNGTLATPEAKQLIDTWAYLGGNASTLQPGFLIKNAVFITNILNNKLKVNVGGIMKCEGKSVTFKDGSKMDNIDSIMVCIGFKTEFPFLNKDDFPWCGDFRKLWKQSVYPADPTLAFCGFARPISGGVPVCAEMTARVLARLYNGKCSLPKDIHAVVEEDRRFQLYACRHNADITTLITSQLAFMDSLAVVIGCQPQPWKMLFTDPFLLWQVYTYGFNPAQYRLFGPHGDYSTARKACFEMERGWSSLKVMLLIIDSLTPAMLPRLVGIHKWANLSIDVERWSFGGKPRYPEPILKKYVMAD